MAAPGSWFRTGTVTVTNASDTVVGVGTAWKTSATPPEAGDIFTIDGKNFHEIIEVTSELSLKLHEQYMEPTTANTIYAIIRNTSATINSRLAGQVTRALNQKQVMIDEQNAWLVSTKDSENFTDALGNVLAVMTPHKMEEIVNDSVNNLNDTFVTARTQADMNAMRAEVDRITAASGMLHAGSHQNNGTIYIAINQGLYVRNQDKSPSITWANKFGLGRFNDATSDSLSKTSFAVTAIAGFVSKITANGDDSYNHEKIKLPTAPVDGTCTFDSATGEYLDFKVDVDPKYGDVAPDHKEAVARAFEGMAKSGDIRNGDDGTWLLSGTGGSISVGSIAITDGATAWQGPSQAYENGATYRVEIVLSDVVGSPYFRYTTAGITASGLVNGLNVIKFVYNSSSDINPRIQVESGSEVGSNAILHSVSVHKDTNEVVTAPVDMWGFTARLEEITQLNSDVYPNGLPQSLATNMGGIATSPGSRDDAYYAAYPGDTTSKGNSVKFLDPSTSVIERDVLLGNTKNHIYNIGGKLKQWNVFQTSVRGLGNGDFKNTDCTKGNLEFSTSVPILSPAGNHYEPSKDYKGVFEDGSGYYFLFCGTVSRLSQSMYVEGLNENGTMLAKDGKEWYETTETFLTVADCFNPAKLLVGSGSIASSKSGNPEGRYFDAVYPGGWGGVIDERKSAWGKSKSDMDEVAASVEAGVYRGKEKLKFTKVLPSAAAGSGGHENAAKKVYTASGLTLVVLLDTNTYKFATGDTVFLRNSTLDKTLFGVVGATNPEFIYVNVTSKMAESDWAGDDVYLIQTTETNISVSGEILQKEVIGDPVGILANPRLKNGGVWVWNPNIPDGTTKEYPATRKFIDVIGREYTDDNGVTWSQANNWVGQGGGDKVKNIIANVSTTNARVSINHYTAFAKQTKKSTSKVIKAGSVGKVLVTDSYKRDEGVLLHESLMNAVGTGANFLSYSVLTQAIKSALVSAGHVAIELTGTTSPAVKIITSHVNDGGQAQIQYIANEMIWDATDSKSYDSSKMSIGDGTYTNDNGVACRRDEHDLAISPGWFKNNA